MSLQQKIRRGRWYLNGQILSASGNTSGAWNGVEAVFPMTITVSGSFTATVNIYVETTADMPTDADANHGILTSFTAPGIYIMSAPVEWIKATVTGYSSGSITVTVEASDSLSQGAGY